MGTTKDEIRQWLKDGRENDATHVIIVCDTFDHTDYPVSVSRGTQVSDKLKEYNNPHNPHNMQRVMEVYNLSMDLEKQLAERCAWHPEYSEAQLAGVADRPGKFNVSAGPGSQVQVGENVSGDQVMDEKPKPEEEEEEEYEFDLRVEQPSNTWTLRRKFEGNPAILQRIVNHDADTVITMYVPDELLELFGEHWLKSRNYQVVDSEGDEVQESTKGLVNFPKCGHSACRQNWIDTGELGCVQNEDEVDALEELRKELTESGHGTEVTDSDNYEETIRTAAGAVSDHRKLRDEIGNIRRRLHELAPRLNSELSTIAHETTAAVMDLADQLQAAEDDS